MRQVGLGIVFLMVLARLGVAQETRDLYGRVTDETGGVLIGVSVTVEDGQGRIATTQTDEQGRYRLHALLAGIYRFTCALDGFAPYTQQLDLASPRRGPLDVTLKVSVTEQIDVTSRMSGSLITTTLAGEELARLPEDPRALVRRLRQMAYMLGSPDEVSISVDGFGGSGPLPPVKAIAAIRISGHTFAPEYREPGTGRIEIITKAGLQEFSGDFSFRFNDESLNARNAFASSRAPLQVRDYSGYLGGPITRNGWSFSLYLGRSEQDANEVINATALEPGTLLAMPFVATSVTPTRETSFSARSTFVRTRHTFAVDYTHSREGGRNRGLGGFDLPERAFSDRSRSDGLRGSLTSTLGGSVLHEARVEAIHGSASARAVTSAPAVVVLDAFSAGGNQATLFRRESDDRLLLSDALTYGTKKHTIKVGFGAYAVYRRSLDRSNFGGTFTFGADFERDAKGNPVLDAAGLPIPITPLEHYRRTVLGLSGYQPSQFSIVRGDPSISISQWDLAWFAQDDWSVSPRLTVSYGVRHDLQSNLEGRRNIAPRVGLAWQPFETRTDTLRLASGLFYQGVGTGVTFDATRLDGRHQLELTLQEPTFFATIPEAFPATTRSSPTIHRKSPDLRSPYLAVSTASYQPQLPWNLSGSIAYTWERGMHLVRTRNLNAPTESGSGPRPAPDSGPIFQFESTGVSIRHQLRLALSSEIGSKVSIYGRYALGSSRSDTDGPFSTPADSYELANEFGRASIDPRHKLSAGGWVSLPWALELSAAVSTMSGSPFNITTGFDNNGDALFADRPAFASPSDPRAIVTGSGTFNSNPGLGDRIITRNFGQSPGIVSVDAYLSKSFSFGHHRLTLSAEATNLLNHTNLSRPNGVLTSPAFGTANRADDPRQVNLSMRLSF